MPTQRYRNAAGKVIPGTTTIINKFKEAGGLIHWSWELGMQGLDYRKVRDDAAGAGTITHAMVEADIHGVPGPSKNGIDTAIWEKALSSFQAYIDWKDQSRLEAQETELSLTCECHQYGGTLDAMLVQKKLSIGDWKTSNGVYPEYLIQLAAYAHLWRVNRPLQPIEGGFHLLRFSKVGGDFTHHYWPELDDAWEAFVHMRQLYDLMGKLKERL